MSAWLHSETLTSLIRERRNMLATRPLLSQRILPSVDSPAFMTIAISSSYLLAALLPLLSLPCFHLSSLYLFSYPDVFCSFPCSSSSASCFSSSSSSSSSSFHSSSSCLSSSCAYAYVFSASSSHFSFFFFVSCFFFVFFRDFYAKSLRDFCYCY